MARLTNIGLASVPGIVQNVLELRGAQHHTPGLRSKTKRTWNSYRHAYMQHTASASEPEL